MDIAEQLAAVGAGQGGECFLARSAIDHQADLELVGAHGFFSFVAEVAIHKQVGTG